MIMTSWTRLTTGILSTIQNKGVGVDYSSYKWWETKQKALAGWDGRCKRCKGTENVPIVHHIIPIPTEDNFGVWYNVQKIKDLLGCGEKEEYLIVCKACHSWIHEWLRSPESRIYLRVCENCKKSVLIGFIDGERLAYEMDGRTIHACYFKKT